MAVDPFATTKPRRDRWGRYLVVPPGGGKPVGYTRATTITKTLDDTNSLIPWACTATVVGQYRQRGLAAAWQALIAQHDGDPWYGGGKDAAKRLVETSKEAGGASDRATLGTALHSLVEGINKGGKPPAVDPTLAADLAAYSAAMDAAGIVVDPAMCERVVVLDEYRVAGTADMLAVTVPGHDRPMVADLKTGATLDWSWLPIAIQLAIYAHGDSIYAQGATTEDDQRLPMPGVDLERALVVHLPAGEATCTLHLVDIDAGWEAFRVALDVRKWRSRKGLATPFVPAAAAPPAAAGTPDAHGAAAPTAEAVADAGAVRAAPTVDLRTADGGGTTSPPEPPVAPRDGTGRPGSGGTRRVTDGPDPAVVAIADARRTLNPDPDEGKDRSGERWAGEWDKLQRRRNELDGDAKAWVGALAEDAHKARRSFAPNVLKTQRSHRLTDALVTLAAAGLAVDDVVRAIAAHVMGTDVPLMAGITAGEAWGAMTADEAQQALYQARQLVEGATALVYDAVGPRLAVAG